MPGNNFLKVFEDEVKTIWGDVEELAVDETKAIWNNFKGAFLALTPKIMLEDIVPTFETVFGDLVIHDYADALQKLYMYAEQKAVPWLENLGEHVITAALAAWQASKLAKLAGTIK